MNGELQAGSHVMGFREDDDAILFGLLQDYLSALRRHEAPDPAAAEAWETFYRLCSGIIARTFRSRNRDGAHYGDYAQEIWTILIERFGQMRYDAKRGRLEGLIRSSIRHASIDLARREARRKMPALPTELEEWVASRDDDPEAALIKKDFQTIVNSVIERMSALVSPRDFRVFWLRNIAEKGVQEIAAELGMSPEQVRIQDHRVRKKFLRHLRTLYDVTE
jgi:RNA polymerase sigma factor (sigma-70 family)